MRIDEREQACLPPFQIPLSAKKIDTFFFDFSDGNPEAIPRTIARQLLTGTPPILDLGDLGGVITGHH